MAERYETFLRVKAAESGGERWLTAWATTGDEDLAGDVVSPRGAVFELPLPLLAYHKHDSPVGVVTEAHVSEKGIRVRARVSKGVQLADEIWTLVRDGAIGAVSVGFVALKSKPLASGGLLFEAWRWLELSLTPTPANQNARIISVGKALAYASTNARSIAVPRASQPARPKSILRSADRLALLGGADERQRMYAQFDAAVAHLPLELRGRAAVTRCFPDYEQGTVAFTDPAGRPLATVADDGAVILPDQPQTKHAAPKQAAPDGLSPAQRAEIMQMLKNLAKVVGKRIYENDEKLAQAILGIGERLKATEAGDEGGVHLRAFRGYWSKGGTAHTGELYTHDGSLWVAVRDTDEAPASTSPDWCLAARRGRDGR